MAADCRDCSQVDSGRTPVKGPTIIIEVERWFHSEQRRATKMLSSLRDKPNPERLAALKLPSLEHRWKRGDMIDLYRYLHGI